MRRFELVEGTSSKFWEVALDGADVTVRFGRIGTNGQTKTKTHASAAAASKDHDKLVRKKTAGGYAEVGVAANATLAAVAASPVPVSAPAPAPAHKAATVPVAEAPAPPAPAGDIAWPDGSFQWTAALLADVPIVRGVHVPAFTDATILLAKPIVFIDDTHGYRKKRFDKLAATMGRAWTFWGRADSVEMIRRARLQQPDPDFWLELIAQSLDAEVEGDERPSHYRSFALGWVTRVGIALHGLPFMVELALDFARAVETHTQSLYRFMHGAMHILRAAIAACGDAEHDAVVALLEAQAGATSFDRLLRAMLCPHRQDWVEAGMDDDRAQGHLWLRDAAASPEAMRRYFETVSVWPSHQQDGLMLQLRMHGGEAFGLLADTLRRADSRETRDLFTGIAQRLHDRRVIALLAELSERNEARAALDKLAETYPAAVLMGIVEHALVSRSRLVEGMAVRLALREPVALAQVLAALDDRPRAQLQALLDALRVEDAPADRLPRVLREPPWLGEARAGELPTLQVPYLRTPDRFEWSDADNARFAALPPRAQRKPPADPIAAAFKRLGIKRSGHERVMAGQELRADDLDIRDGYLHGDMDALLLLPLAAMLEVWNCYPPFGWSSYGSHAPEVRAVMARGGVDAIGGLMHYVAAYPEDGLAIAMQIDSAPLSPTAMLELRKQKKAKALAASWIRRHVPATLVVALPWAFCEDPALRDAGQFTLRWLVANGFEAQAREWATTYGAPMSAAFQALLDADPLLVLPARMPKLPAFFVAASFRRPMLRDGGGALPVSALEHIGTMLAISKLDAPYAGLAVVRDACTPESLAEFAWDVFEAWLAAGASSKEAWAFAALGLLGNDETARRLAPRIREWPGQSQHQRAVTGLDMLAAIGSDVALMHLNGIAGKVKFKALQERAKQKVAAVAEARGLTGAEVADRLVPDLGLDERGTLVLDFGPRQFFIAFDETLKPFVKDAQGVRLKDLPKPVKTDDAALADEATERFKLLKKDARTIAALQVTRLEMSMIERRRWPAADFRLFFLEHPLMRHLAARLVWGVYDAQEALTAAFRVAEDRTFADADDAAFELPDDARVGLVHVIELSAPLQAAFGQLLADYEILQPFRQLGRETYPLTAQEKAGAKIDRFAGKTIATGSVMGLVNRGWERGDAQDGGWVGWFSKRVGDGLEVQMELDPGAAVGDMSHEPKQRIPNLVLRQAGTWGDEGLSPFDTLHPIVASEVLRDADLLSPFVDA